MSESDAPIPNPSATSGAKPADGDRRRHRGRRGGRGRRKPGAVPAGGHMPQPAEPETPALTETTVPEQPGQPLAPSPSPEPKPLVQRLERLTERVAAQRVAVAEPAHRGSAISQAIDEVMEIVEALRHTVDQMEDVLELVELAERQKLGDEREIESLRRALRNIHQRPDIRRGDDETRRGGGEGRRNDRDPRRSGESPRRGADQPVAGRDEPSPPDEV